MCWICHVASAGLLACECSSAGPVEISDDEQEDLDGQPLTPAPTPDPAEDTQVYHLDTQVFGAALQVLDAASTSPPGKVQTFAEAKTLVLPGPDGHAEAKPICRLRSKTRLASPGPTPSPKGTALPDFTPPKRVYTRDDQLSMKAGKVKGDEILPGWGVHDEEEMDRLGNLRQ